MRQRHDNDGLPFFIVFDVVLLPRGVISRSGRQRTSEEATNYCDPTIILKPLFLALQRSLWLPGDCQGRLSNSLKKANQATAKVESSL